MLQVSGFHHESSVFLQACFHPVCSCLHGCDWLHSKWNPQWMLCTNTRLLNRYFQTSTKEKITYINLHPYLAVADPDLQIRGWGRSSRPRDKGVGRVGAVSKNVPWVPEVFLACGGNFRCWPKVDTSSAVG